MRNLKSFVSILLISSCSFWSSAHAQEVRLIKLEWKTPEEVGVAEPKVSTLKRQPASAAIDTLKEMTYLEVSVPEQTTPGVTNLRFSNAIPMSKALGRDAGAIARTRGISLPLGNSAKRCRVYAIYNPGKEADAPPAKVLELRPAPKPADSQVKYAWVTVVLDRKGNVIETVPESGVDQQHGEAAAAAAKKWRFSEPWRTDDKGQASLRVPVLFIATSKDGAGNTPGKTKPVLVKRPDLPRGLDLPDDAYGRGSLEVSVSETGRVTSVALMNSSNPAWAEILVNMYLSSEYKPATKDGQPVAAKIREGMGMAGKTVESLSHTTYYTPSNVSITPAPSGDSEPHGAATSKPYDKPPELYNMPMGAYPLDLLQQGVEGKVSFILKIDDKGRAAQPADLDATHDELKLAARAMIDAMRFQPALLGKRPVGTAFRSDITFGLRKGDVHPSASVRDIADVLKSKPESIATSKDAGEPVEQIVFLKPMMPSESWRTVESGTAEIEFVIDKNGHAQLPRIVSATDQAFGYAAAQAVAFWRFKPVKLNGKPALVRHKVTINFPADCSPALDSISISPEP